MAENNTSLSLDDFRSNKYSEYQLQSLILIIKFSFLLTENRRPDIKDLCRYVLPLYAAHWKEIGIFLGIQPGQLDVIKSNNPVDANGCCIDLFGKWLQGTDNVTWEKMFEVIDLITVSFCIGNTAATITTTTSR